MTTTELTDVSDLPPLTTKKQVAKWFGCSERHWDAMVRDGKAPPPIYPTKRSPRWRRSELLAWLDSQSDGIAAAE